MVRRIVMSLMSLGVVLGLGTMPLRSSFGQDAKKADAAAKGADAKSSEAQKPAPPAKDAKPATPAPDKDKDKKDEKAKEKEKEAQPAPEPPLPPIPKEVHEKIEAARKAVAEAIVAAQDAGLVETSIDPPPILDILVTERATDARIVKNASSKKPYALSPEVFAAWFTGYAAPGFESIDYAKDVRIVHPSAGLKAYFDQRAAILRNAIAEVRKAKGQPAPAAATKPEAKPETKPEVKAEPKKAAEPKK